MKLTEEQICEIADNLDMGMRCFYNLKTAEIEVIPDFDDSNWLGHDTEPWQETMHKLEENWGDFFEFKRITSNESFEMMADFSESVENKKLQDRLFKALNKPKPFRNFKWEIDNSGEFRQKWFDFKTLKLKEIVKTQIELHNKSILNNIRDLE